ncbi:MAG: threonine ammonia-lyase [Saccharofermentanaceae bacterium]|jgi:threonine dehydratase|nr:threonine ammonia-lyase [Clostridia bacterium]NLX69038.1 threonine ammonia-lyase [Clostridiaceae bacterium]HOO48492.1 threonine ammonia-lyase [Saccharofermentans sp.]HOX40980.1 threonine ammonia-lyase [bacterium]HPE27610.1 threonine ammonia-lyase [Saccharofermentans sp.]
MLTLDKVFDAQSVLKNIIRETSLVRAYGIAPECELYLKPENLQITGSFKIRGSAYKISLLSDEEKAKGVVACSAGNHAQGVALAATKSGIKSLICLPDTAPISKIEATKSFGADVCLVKGCYDDAHQKALQLKESEGYTFIHPFDDEDVIAGQGTIALEVLNELENIDAIVVPVGGGGLISGIAFAAKQIKPSVKIYGVQVAGAASMFNSVRDCKIECLQHVHTIADGIAVKKPGENTFKYVNEYVDELALVTDDEVSSAILGLIEKQKMIAEGAGAASVAAVMFDKFPLKGKRVVCIVSGGNIDVTSLSRVIERGLFKSGRSSSLLIELIDKPGQLKDISKIIADNGANVTGVHYEKGNTESVNGCFLRIEIETRDYEHIQTITDALRNEGFKIF